MSTPIKFTGTTKAWTTSTWHNIDHVLETVKQEHLNEAADELSFTNNNMSHIEDWTEVGIAEITVTFYPRDTVVAKELDGLNTQLQKVRAENQQRENAILDRISKLQAITYEAPEEF
jgi:hypothetical protein